MTPRPVRAARRGVRRRRTDIGEFLREAKDNAIVGEAAKAGDLIGGEVAATLAQR